MDMIEVSAKTVSDAITEACQKLGVTSDKLDYEVVEEGSSGFLGIGAKSAVIKASVKKSSVEEVARVFLNDVFQAMNMEVVIAIKYNEEEKNMDIELSGNEMGVLLLDYICAGRIEKGTMPEKAVAVKSLVSTPLADAVAAHYGVELRNVLTGFKWIGDQIANLEAAGEVDRFIFGFEESYGYLAGPYVRDKDAVIASMLICEMAAYYRSIGSSLKQRLEEIYAEYGRYLNKIDSFEFPGLSGMDKMSGIMQNLRENAPAEIAGYKVTEVTDYTKTEETGLPVANVLVYKLENNETVIVRPSGTEPKIKIYYTTLGNDLAEAQAEKNKLAEALKPIMA